MNSGGGSRVRAWLAGLGVCLSALAAGSAGAAPRQAIVSLDLCSDWLLMHYAPPHRVAGLSPLSERDPPPWAQRATWRSHDGTLEGILSLRPDQIVVGVLNAPLLRRRLEALKIPVLVIDWIDSLERLSQQTERFLEILAETGFPRSRSSTGSSPSGLEQAGTRGRLLILGPNGYGTGLGTLEDSIISAAGWRNLLQDTGHRMLEIEGLAQRPPDAIVWVAPKGNALANHFAGHRLLDRLVPRTRWLATDDWRWQCPGPWSLELIRQLQQQ